MAGKIIYRDKETVRDHYPKSPPSQRLPPRQQEPPRIPGPPHGGDAQIEAAGTGCAIAFAVVAGLIVLFFLLAPLHADWHQKFHKNEPVSVMSIGEFLGAMICFGCVLAVLIGAAVAAFKGGK